MAATIDFKQTRVGLELKHPSPLIGCRFDPSGRYLFVSAQDDTHPAVRPAHGPQDRRTWPQELGPRHRLHADQGRADADAFESAGPRARGVGNASAARPAAPFTLVTGDYHGKLIWWDGAADVPAPVRTVVAHDGWCRAVAMSPDGKTVASCGNDHLVKLWNAVDGKAIRSLEGHESHVYNIAFHPAGGRIVSCDLKGIVKDWDLNTGKVVRELDAKVLHKYDTGFRADIGGARGMAFSADGSTLACTGITNVSNAFAGVGNPLVVQFDWKDGKPKQLKPKEAYQGTGWGVAIHPAGFTVAAGGAANGRIWFWTGDENVHKVDVPVNCHDMAVHPSGTAIAIAGHNGTAMVYTMLPAPKAAKK